MTLQKLSQYGKGFQLKVLGALLTDKTFLLNVRDVIKEEYFDSVPLLAYRVQHVRWHDADGSGDHTVDRFAPFTAIDE